MPERARVAQFEDDKDYIFLSGLYLKRSGHDRVSLGTTFTGSLDVISEIPKRDINIAIVDGNLTPGRSDNSEGRELVKLIRSADPRIVIIGNCGFGLVEGADLQCPKSNSFEDLAKLVSLAPYPARRIYALGSNLTLKHI